MTLLSKAEADKIFGLEISHPDLEVRVNTVRKFLIELVWKVWDENEGFSGKRPWGNGDWKYPIYEALIVEGLIDGKFDEDGLIKECDHEYGDRLILACIREWL